MPESTLNSLREGVMNTTLNQNIESDENVVWYGRPKQGVIFDVTDILGLAIGTAQLVVSSFLFIMFLKSNIRHNFMILDGMMFLIVAVIFLIYSALTFYIMLFSDAKLRKKTNYTITNKRIIIDYGYNSDKRKKMSFKLAIPELPPQSLPITDLPEITLQYVAKDGYRTIDFGLPAIYKSTWAVRGGGSVINIYPKLDRIKNVEEVFKAILKVKYRLQAHSSYISPVSISSERSER